MGRKRAGRRKHLLLYYSNGMMIVHACSDKRFRKANRVLNPKRSKILGVKCNCETASKENKEMSENFEEAMQMIEGYLNKNEREKGQQGLAIKDKCPYCGSRTSEVDVIEELIEFAERTDTKVEFVEDNHILVELGGVGGLLRFKP